MIVALALAAQLAARLAPAVAAVAEVPAGGVCSLTGIPGTGKSAVLKLAAARGAFPGRLVVYDTYARRDAIEAQRGNTEVHPWDGEPVSWRDLIAGDAAELLAPAELPLIVDPGTLDAAELGRRFARLARLCFAHGGIDIAAEEAGIYARGAVQAANIVATGSRHARVRLYVVSQRYMRIPVDVRDNLTTSILFACGGASDLKEIRAKCGAETEAKARRLVKGGPPLIWRLGA